MKLGLRIKYHSQVCSKRLLPEKIPEYMANSHIQFFYDNYFYRILNYLIGFLLQGR